MSSFGNFIFAFIIAWLFSGDYINIAMLYKKFVLMYD